jgi:hypothetical protein
MEWEKYISLLTFYEKFGIIYLTMKEFNRQTVRELASALETTIKTLESQFGIKFNYRGARFTSSNITFKIEAAVVGQGGEVMNKERQDYKNYAYHFQLDPAWLDQAFSWSGDTYKIVGLKPRCWTSPVLVTRVRDSKSFKMSKQMVIDSFKLKGLK